MRPRPYIILTRSIREAGEILPGEGFTTVVIDPESVNVVNARTWLARIDARIPVIAMGPRTPAGEKAERGTIDSCNDFTVPAKSTSKGVNSGGRRV